MTKNLIIYYSRKEENYRNGNIKNLTKKNMEIVAGFIQKAIDGNQFKAKTVKSYT